MRRTTTLTLVLLGIGASACTNPETAEQDPGAWVQIWEDEFALGEGEPVDPDKWVHDVGGDGWGNDQLEYNTDRTDNVRHNGTGVLTIQALIEDYEGNGYTSGRIKTQDKFSFSYGRVEARIRLPEGSGMWPAFWLLGDSIDEVGWPLCGEIDIMEMRGSEPYIVHGTVHGPGYSAGDSIGGPYTLNEGTFNDDYHVFAVDIDPGHISWSVDDEVYFTLGRGDLPEGTGWVFDDNEFFILLNVAVGGTYVGEVDDSALPQSMRVDYVRVFERAE